MLTLDDIKKIDYIKEGVKYRGVIYKVVNVVDIDGRVRYFDIVIADEKGKLYRIPLNHKHMQNILRIYWPYIVCSEGKVVEIEFFKLIYVKGRLCYYNFKIEGNPLKAKLK